MTRSQAARQKAQAQYIITAISLAQLFQPTSSVLQGSAGFEAVRPWGGRVATMSAGWAPLPRSLRDCAWIVQVRTSSEA